jgi:DNA mismatch repair ATPase MutL
MSQNHSAACNVDPFLCLHLQCPVGNYDVNIEPAKDEVLFTDTRQVRNLLEDFLKDLYGDYAESTEAPILSRNRKANSSISMTDQFELLLAKKEQHPAHERGKNASKLEGSAGVTDPRTQPMKTDLKSRAPAADELLKHSHDENRHTATGNILGSSEKHHRNMYDCDEDDLGSMEPKSVLEQSAPAEVDDAELRKASVTNPWSIAKLNAPVMQTASPSRNLIFGDNEQLMTPSPDIRSTELISTIHGKSLSPRTNLPSPARSEVLRSPSVYQNPGPPPRRKAPVSQLEEDEIEFTQDSINEGPTHRHPTSLEVWAKEHAQKPELPNGERLSITLDRDSHSDSQHENVHENSEVTQTEMQSTQVTDRTEGLEPTFPSRIGFRKPFISPFKSPARSSAPQLSPRPTPTTSPGSNHQSPTRQQLGLSQDDNRTTSVFSHGEPSLLSQTQRHPMASPPVLQPSSAQPSKSSRLTAHMSHPDLDEIMDFEHRKKAVNTQRKNHFKLNDKHLNSGQLAQLQRNSTTFVPASELGLSSSSPFRKHPAPRLNVRDATQTSYNSAKPIKSSSSNQDPISDQETPNHSPQKQSPHQNRYQAAKAALTPFKPPAPSSPPHPSDKHEFGLEAPDSDPVDNLPHLPENDPRAYLFQHLSASRAHPSSSLKIHRTKPSKLPFETIPLASATHHLSARPTTPFPSLDQITTQLHRLAAVDPYPRTGRNDFTVWDANSTDLPDWEAKIENLVREKYVVRLGGLAGEEVPADRKVRLGVVLRAYGEGLT